MTAFLFYYALLHALVTGMIYPTYRDTPTLRYPLLAALLWPLWLIVHILSTLGEAHGK
jgi:hypothetical protein